ncbi:hypothetical protein VE04_04052 [Pseudogymnoascus sp. 24MN13]|uniref:Uncharacterized protein n=1 Tax=Pseudogymnoascus verrucosus TaxID=342668 RepID=A0A1B8GCU9_9PEZI|nr:uncharacterized protein VE01_08070 [Pseudogymnoascus verrucosus]OBT55315.1 hypothetical protein VE04_04052 [Pseudogymnoascus sp. 24MN13]OBT93653.1 hypothetical protein VE01_08070 [Pseudogymnoascus verrucosus]
MPSPISWFRALTPKAQGLIGMGLLSWGAIGLYASDAAEEKLGFKPSEEEKAALRAATPRISVVDRE